ncbi:transcriptional regulator STERILE APETALA-like [Salvia splendens]|uniref:transcriptional regulator STERILE APETALA-like n=1 Tax=Salvia splendens TaxID=180675 RepID=UPI001C255B4F|nr:transcriptional regulator STERILE APETALA-like [Salvia splendens]
MSTSSSSSSNQGGDAPSSSRSRMRSSNGVWPEPFLEALALHVAVDASRTIGRLAAAQALFNIFQVCSTWRAISRSDLLWQNLARSIWNVRDLLLLRESWREEYVYRHRTAAAFRSRRYEHAALHFDPTDNNNDDDDGLSCRRLALSNHHLAAGFSDGAVHLFHIPTLLHLFTFYPQHRDRLGRFSSPVSGIILSDARLVFATLDGDIHMAAVNGPSPLRRAHLGDVVTDGALVDFAGCDRWWVGLYAGVPGRAFHIWNGETEELVSVGGSLTDPEAVMGWHMLTELTGIIGRIRVVSGDMAVACTRDRVVVLPLISQGVLEEREEEFPREIVVGAFDAYNDLAMVPDAQGEATVRRVQGGMEEVCRFTMREGVSFGCMNGGYGVTWGGGVIRVWDIEHGQYLYSFRERIGECNALIADERFVAACCDDAIIHLWDFGAQ